MVERKLYKTKLCVLYQRGHCPRQSCSFAHGDAELRRFSGSFNGRRDYRGSDLRDKLDKRSSPLRRYSPGRDAKGRHTSQGYSSHSSLGKRSDRKRKKQQVDGQSDFSGSLKISDGIEDQVKDKKLTSSNFKDILDKELRQVQSEIDTMDGLKHQLEIFVEERIQEADSLTSKFQELEMQLCEEKEKCKRITSKIKKFIKAHNSHSRIQDELKRSQARLQKLGDQLGSDATRSGANEEDLNINILSDGETTGNHVMSPRNELQKNASPSKKRLRIHLEADEESKQANPIKEGFMTGTIRSEKLSQWNVHRAQFNTIKEAEAEGNGNNGCRSLANEDNLKWGRNVFTNIPSADKLKGSESGLVLPSTCMAAHAGDEVVEVVEMEEKFEVVETASTGVEKGVAYEILGKPFLLPPPPPPVRQNAYSKYKGDDENVDVEGLDEEMVVEIV